MWACSILKCLQEVESGTQWDLSTERRHEGLWALFVASTCCSRISLFVHDSLLCILFSLPVWSTGKEWCYIKRPTHPRFVTKPSYSHIFACCRLIKALWPLSATRLFIRRMAVFDSEVIHFHLSEKGMWTSALSSPQCLSGWETSADVRPSILYMLWNSYDSTSSPALLVPERLELIKAWCKHAWVIWLMRRVRFKVDQNLLWTAHITRSVR